MSSILDEPINWTRDEEKQQVPQDGSLAHSVEQQWHEIHLVVYDGAPVTDKVRAIEDAIIHRKRLLAANSLNPVYDWAHDIELAR